VSITASGLYGLTLEKFFIDTAGESLEAEDNKGLMVTDTHTPNFDTHDFRDDVTNEVTGTGYTAGGNAITTTEITLSGGVLTYDAADAAWATSTIANARAEFGYHDAVTDELLFMSAFAADASSAGGTFTIQRHASGIFTVDYTP
jgi:hypothetical protein